MPVHSATLNECAIYRRMAGIAVNLLAYKKMLNFAELNRNYSKYLYVT